MKAAQIAAYGHADMVEVVEIDKPTPGAAQVLIEVHAASLNPFDTLIREGALQQAIPLKLPVTLGGDLAGVVVAVGEGVGGLVVGDRVYGDANVVAGNSGALAEYATATVGKITHAPANLGFAEAAALPLVGVSALQALVDHINLQPGQTVFIHGASGGIGLVAVQLAKHLGAQVIATAKGGGVEFVRGLGADEVIDSERQAFTETLQGRKVDAVLHLVRGDDFAQTFQLLEPGSVAVTLVAQGFEAAAQERGITAIGQMTSITTDKLNVLRAMVENGTIKPHVGPRFALADIRAAFAAREHGGALGKVVVDITP